LNVFAQALGFATSVAPRSRRARSVQEDSAPDANDPGMHADAGDLGNPRLRRGRPNGKSV
jgi:hypothetical protein